MPTKTEQIIAGLESIFNRELTEDESNSVEIWQKCSDVARFLEAFPNEWSMFKEMLRSYLDDLNQEWKDAAKASPETIGDLKTKHAYLSGATTVVEAFIRDAEAAPEIAKQIPPTVREGMIQLQARPKEI